MVFLLSSDHLLLEDIIAPHFALLVELQTVVKPATAKKLFALPAGFTNDEILPRNFD